MYHVCIRCLLGHVFPAGSIRNARSFSRASQLLLSDERGTEEKEEGAMTRKLSDMAEEAIETGGKGSRRVMEEAGFSEELKRQLEERIAQSSFRSDHAGAFAHVELPSSAGQGTKDITDASPWTGSESLEDASLRMLTDVHKPLKTPFKAPPPGRGPLNLRSKKQVKQSTGQRLINARDKASIYETARESEMSDKEREQIRKELKERFTPGARPMPTSITGLQSLANERIEDAIARGQFKNIPRGKGTNVERDHNADSAFIDTTSYLLNKIVQKQDIIPPWIEKQQELLKEVGVFRKRLRSDWKRHSARVIASYGGSLQQQIRRAKAYADAEARVNPKVAKTTMMSAIDPQGNLSKVTAEETTLTQDPAITIPAHSDISQPFRDPSWLKTESAYHSLAINSINSLTRSYNLMAPKLAQKPYYSLNRELDSCFADVAAELPAEIERRARMPEKTRVNVVGNSKGGVMERFTAGEKVKVWDEERPSYGFREFWRDLWNKEMAKT